MDSYLAHINEILNKKSGYQEYIDLALDNIKNIYRTIIETHDLTKIDEITDLLNKCHYVIYKHNDVDFNATENITTFVENETKDRRYGDIDKQIMQFMISSKLVKNNILTTYDIANKLVSDLICTHYVNKKKLLYDIQGKISKWLQINKSGIMRCLCIESWFDNLSDDPMTKRLFYKLKVDIDSMMAINDYNDHGLTWTRIESILDNLKYVIFVFKMNEYYKILKDYVMPDISLIIMKYVINNK